MLPVALHPSRTMHVVKKEFMYVSNPFGGEGGVFAKGDKITIGCLAPAFWGAHKWAEMLRHPCILDDPQQRGQNQSNMG